MNPPYIKPTLTIVDFHIERGYTLSLPTEVMEPVQMELLFLEENGQQQGMETFEQRSGWVDDESNSFF